MDLVVMRLRLAWLWRTNLINVAHNIISALALAQYPFEIENWLHRFFSQSLLNRHFVNLSLVPLHLGLHRLSILIIEPVSDMGPGWAFCLWLPRKSTKSRGSWWQLRWLLWESLWWVATDYEGRFKGYWIVLILFLWCFLINSRAIFASW